MLELLYRIFIGHCHVWERSEEAYKVMGADDVVPDAIVRVYHCKHCGKPKTFKIKN